MCCVIAGGIEKYFSKHQNVTSGHGAHLVTSWHSQKLAAVPVYACMACTGNIYSTNEIHVFPDVRTGYVLNTCS
jgi:hypothetical protein